MSLKSIIRKYFPLPLVTSLRYMNLICCAPFKELLRRRKARRIIAEAEKYLPYYQDDLSLEILKGMEEYVMTLNDDIFFKKAVEQGWRNHRLVHLNWHPNEVFSDIVLLYDKEDKEFEQHKIMLEGCGLDYRLVKFRNYINGAKIRDDELAIAILTKRNMIWLVGMTRTLPSNIALGHSWTVREEDQYLDCFSPKDNEIILDVGAYTGDTAERFMKWGGDKIRHIYAFEFDPINAEKCEKNTRCYGDRVTVIRRGAWDREQTMYLAPKGSPGTSVRSKGSVKIQLSPIDSVIQNEPVTFIKMDIEGAELKALMGAKNTIIRNHPRLAICVYHKPEDICEIPGYILSLVPEYKFYLRTYSSRHDETVLYAYCE